MESSTIFACQQCGAALQVVGRTTTCPYCASPSVIERPAARDLPNPAFVITFAAGDEMPRRALADWVKRQSIFADSALRRAKLEDLTGVYVPGYLYSAVAWSRYQCEIGENYTEIETYTTTDSQGNTQVHTRTVTRTEWRTLYGEHVGYVTDVVVSASAGLPNDELEAVEPFDLRLLRRYDAGLISGWTTEEPSHGRDQCLALAHGEASGKVGGAIARMMPGDSQRGLTYQSNVQWETMDPVLVPVWVLAVRYHPERPPLRLVVNGQTGRAHGKAPLSWWKITLAVLVALAVIGGLIYLLVRPT